MGTPILHWFSGSVSELDRAIEMGCWFSVGLPMARSARGLAHIAPIPHGRLSTETDAPFTAEAALEYNPSDLKSAIDGIASA